MTAGGIGFIAGAITGGISYGIGKIAQGIGEQFGYLLSNTKIGSLLVSKVFSLSFLTITFGIMGNAVGGLGTSLFGDYLANNLFYSSYKKNDAKDTAASVIFDWFLQFVYWIFNL